MIWAKVGPGEPPVGVTHPPYSGMVLKGVNLKSKEMKKHSLSNFSVMNNGRDNQFNHATKDTAAKKNVKYIYTENDLGEGLLEAGVPESYTVGKQQPQYIN